MPVTELDYSPYEYQMELHTDPARYKVVVGGRRVGKSKMGLQEMIKHCLEQPGAQAWWVAPTVAMAREVGWEEFKENYLEDLLPALTGVHETLMRVRFRNGSVMYFKGGDSERALRGRGLTYVVIDEAAFVDETVWTRALMPALADRRGSALLLSTPNGRNWFFDLANHAYNNSVSGGLWRYWHWPSYMNPLMSQEELESIAATISEMDFRQEFLGEFVTRAGMVYDDFGPENIIHVEPGTLLSPSTHEYDIYLGMDFGYANPTAVAFMAVERTTNHVTMFDELYVARTKIEDIQTLIAAKLNAHGINVGEVNYVYTDPAGNAEELSSGISPVDSLRMGQYRFKVANKATRIAPGVALVRAFIKAASGERKFFVTSICKEAIRSLYGYTYDKKDNSEVVKEEPLKDGIHDHMCDAIRYFFVNKFDHARWIWERPESYEYGMNEKHQTVNMKRCSECHRQFSSRTPKNKPPFVCKECNETL